MSRPTAGNLDPRIEVRRLHSSALKGSRKFFSIRLYPKHGPDQLKSVRSSWRMANIVRRWGRLL